MRTRDWDEFKTYLDRGLSAQERKAEDDQVEIHVFDGPIHIHFRAYTGETEGDPSAEWTEYVNNYRTNAGKTFTDSNNIPLSRGKVTQTGWFYQEHAIEINTATLDGVFNEDRNGNDLGFVNCNLLNSNGDITLVEADAVETVITWEPTHDFEIIGSQFYQASAPTTNIRMWTTALPDYPAPSGSIPFVEGGVNLRYMGTGNILTVDGRSAKNLKYNDPVPGTNKFELRFKHDAGVKHDIQVIVEMFRP